MKTIRESNLFESNRRYSERTSIVGAFQMFEKDIFRDKFFYPHEEMAACIKAYNGNSLVQSAVNTMKDFIKGGDIVVKSEDEESRKAAQEYMDKLQVDWWVDEIIENCIKTGNAFLEVDWEDIENRIPKKCYPLADSSRIYINCNEYGEPFKKLVLGHDPVTREPVMKEELNEEEFYIQRIDAGFRLPNAKWYDMSYHAGFMFKKFRIYGIPINRNKIIHFKLNIGDTGIYARSYLASALNDYEVLSQIERSLAIIAKYKAVPRDIIMYGDKDNPATDDELDEFIIYMESLEKEESAIVNKPIKRESLAYAGQDINLDYMITHIRKKIIAGIAPDFMMGLGSDITSASAQISLISYILSIYSKRKLFLKPIERFFLEPFVARNNLKKCWLEFGELDFETKSEKVNRVGAMWTQNLITFNRAQKMLGEPNIGPKGDVYYMKWQSDMMQPEMPGYNQLGNGGVAMPELGADENEELAPNDLLPNGEPADKVFSHNEPANKKPAIDGGSLPHDPFAHHTNEPKFVPKSDTAKKIKGKYKKEK